MTAMNSLNGIAPMGMQAPQSYQEKVLMRVMSKVEDLGDGTYSIPKRIVNGEVTERSTVDKMGLLEYVKRQTTMLKGPEMHAVALERTPVQDQFVSSKKCGCGAC